MPIFTQAVEPSADVAEARARFLADLHAWITDCMARYGDAPATDVHDQGTYITGWEPYLRATGDREVLAFITRTRDRIRDHFVTTDQWRHGYWRMQEAHHGTEHFELFLGMLSRVAPSDSETRRQLFDAAEHMGNWSAEAPPWFDWERRRFRSLFFGTDGVRLEPGMDVNTPDHLRCVNICLLAFDAFPNDRRFLDLAVVYMDEWAQAILAGERLPLALTPTGALHDFAGPDEAVYRAFAGEAPDLHGAVDRAENFLTSDGVNTFLRLWQETGHQPFRQAAERILDPLVTQLADPDAGAAAGAVRAYRQWTGDTRYDAAVLDAVADLDPFAVGSLGLDTDFRLGHRPSGVGKRSDMPRWLEDGAPRRCNPITLSVAAEIRGDR
ncbi:MAG: hypothetical protein D6790_19885, partial [Caldilineae bacterium]